MGSSLSSYEIARSGMYVSERGLFVTGQNVSNVNTTGYSRQQSIAQTTFYQGIGNSNMQVGTGATIEQTRQIRNTFLDNVYRKESQLQGYAAARSKTYSEIQNILAEPIEKGLQDTMNNFWNSWQELSKDPDSLTVRALVRQRGQALVDYANQMGKQLDRLQNDLNTEIADDLNKINDITYKLAALNIEIPKVESSGDRANDLRDQRNVLLDKLTNMINADINEKQNGEIEVTIGGYFLVNGKESTKVVPQHTATSGMFYTPMLDGTTIELPVKSGSLKGLLESRGEVYGAVGSTSNGTPSANMDITFAVDISNPTSVSNAKSKIAEYVAQMNTPNMNTKFRLITFSTGSTLVGEYTSAAAFQAAVSGLSDVASPDNDFGSVVTTLSSGAVTYAPNADKYAVVFTNESIGGNTGAATNPAGYITTLNSLGMKVSVATTTNYFDSGETGTGELGWNEITSKTGGHLYSTDAGTDLKAMMESISCDSINESISTHMNNSINILPDFRQRLNALINVIAREVNRVQRSGMTIHSTPVAGTDFFEAIDGSRPIEVGNIKLNSNLSDLNRIITGKTGAKGDSTLAKEVSALRNKDCTGDYKERLSLDEFYQGIITYVGNNGQAANALADSQAGLVQAAENQRQSISAVSMDEEMTMMLKYQFAYGGASKVFNTIDEMVNTIVNKMGLVGR